jgi:hypothetical protein
LPATSLRSVEFGSGSESEEIFTGAQQQLPDHARGKAESIIATRPGRLRSHSQATAGMNLDVLRVAVGLFIVFLVIAVLLVQR